VAAGKDTLARDRACPCPQPRTRVEELDAAVWDHVKRLLDDPATLAAQFEERARQADALDAGAGAAGQRCEALLRRLDREEQRLLDAYQAEAIDLDELKRRREQIRGRRLVLTTQRDQEQRLRSERQTAKEVWADLTAFCQRVRSRLDEATLAEKQRILQLLIDRVIVGEDTLEIRHVIPLGRLKAEPANSGPSDPTGSGGGEGDEPEGATPNGLDARLRSDGVECAELMRHLAEDRGDRPGIERRAVGGDPLEDQFSRLQSGVEAAEEGLDVLVSRVVVEDLIGEPLEGPVVDDREDAERPVIQLVGRDIAREVGQGPVEIVWVDPSRRLFPPRPRPSSGSLRRGRRRGAHARGSSRRSDRASRPR
jgi:hypothetical protein